MHTKLDRNVMFDTGDTGGGGGWGSLHEEKYSNWTKTEKINLEIYSLSIQVNQK